MNDDKVKWVNQAHQVFMLGLTSAEMMEMLGRMYDLAVIDGCRIELQAQNQELRAKLNKEKAP